MRLMSVLLLLLSVSALADDTEIPLTDNSTTPIQFQYTWLSIARFQMLTDGEQNSIVVTSRDFLVLTMHEMSKHRIAACVKHITNIEMVAIKNTMLAVEPNEKEYAYSAVARISNRLFGLCSISNQNQERDSNRA